MGDANSKNSEPNEFAGLIGTFTKYGTLLVGGLCLLMYSNEIGQFPEGMGIGEGLAFYLVCAGFLIAYSLYTGICTATGCLLLAWPARMLHRVLVRREALGRRRVGQILLHTDFSTMWELPVVALGIVGLIGHGIFIYYSSQPVQAALFLAVPLAQGAGMVFLLVVTRRKQHLESGVLLPEYSDQSIMTKRRDTVTARRVFFVWLVLAPLLLAPEKLFLVDAAFKLAQLRKDGATVHVKAPWSARVGQSTLAKATSFMGTDYVEFKKVNVLLRSVGQKVVIELPSASGVSRLSIPSDSIYVE
ncbi:MAG: hypothetical protein EPO01_21590 [Aquabacterium sp.]|nr:MAG: hypothetical protein EPO01_21590 [Aquabacterium sp.]